MFSLGLVYLLVSVVLFAVAVVVHFNSTFLSLPISPVISTLAAILPIAAFLNAYIHPSLLYNSINSSSRLHRLAPIVLQTLQALIATILATLLFEAVVPSESLGCRVENEWMRMFRAHNAGAIRRVQDALECCGLNSIKDRAYPFGKIGPSSCAETYGRSRSCRGPWMAAMQTNAGVDFGVVIAVGLLQIFGLLMMTEGTNWWTAWRARKWRQDMGPPESHRPLLTAVEDEEESTEREERQQNGHGAMNGYGATNGNTAGPRVEPSPINERNAWDERYVS